MEIDNSEIQGLFFKRAEEVLNSKELMVKYSNHVGALDCHETCIQSCSDSKSCTQQLHEMKKAGANRMDQSLLLSEAPEDDVLININQNILNNNKKNNSNTVLSEINEQGLGHSQYGKKHKVHWRTKKNNWRARKKSNLKARKPMNLNPNTKRKYDVLEGKKNNYDYQK